MALNPCGWRPHTRVMKSAVLLIFLGLTALSRAATMVVTTTNDVIAEDGETSLREAIIWANTNAGLDTILIPAGVYSIEIAGSEDDALAGDLDVRDSLVMQGAGARSTIVDGNDLDRVFFFDQDIEVWMSDLTVAGGLTFGDGGGLYNQSTARISRCNFVGNGAFNVGGAMEQYSGALFLDRCAIYFNAAGGAGSGGVDVHSGFCSISNSTLSRNVSLYGGALLKDGGTVHVFSCTIVSNSAQNAGGGIWGGVDRMANTIVADNSAPAGPDLQGGFLSDGYNLIGNPSGTGGFEDTDLTHVAARITRLRFNGGETPTHAPAPDSPAINRADPFYPVDDIPDDQRGAGFSRLRGVRVDIGAFEFPDPDEDGDGIPDEWEMQFGSDPYDPADAGEDADGDSFTAFEEYVADTNPTNPASFHHIAVIAEVPEGLAVSFPSSTNRRYRLQMAEGGPTGAWTFVSDLTTGAVSLFTTITNPAAPPSAGYRVGVSLPPP